jgi:hypothetical protein
MRSREEMELVRESSEFFNHRFHGWKVGRTAVHPVAKGGAIKQR